MNDQVGGSLRALMPLLAAVFTGWGLDSNTAALAAGAIFAIGAVAWSWYSNRLSKKVADVAVAAGTTVSARGTTITLVDPELAKAARDAATDVRGK